jgi:hypothetical protein
LFCRPEEYFQYAVFYICKPMEFSFPLTDSSSNMQSLSACFELNWFTSSGVIRDVVLHCTRLVVCHLLSRLSAVTVGIETMTTVSVLLSRI